MKIISSYMAFAMAFSLAIIPASVFAKTNGNGNGLGLTNKTQLRTQTQIRATVCPTNAFGHLIAPGWNKKNGTTTVPFGCLLPSGIARIFGYNVATSSSNGTTAPVITNLVITPSPTTAIVTWSTNELADSAVFYSTTTPINASATTTPVVYSAGYVTSHSLTIANLSQATTYYIIVRSRDMDGHVTTLSPVSFTTGTATDTIAPALTNIVSIVGTSSVRFLWVTNESATSKVFFSTSTPVNVTSSTTPYVENASLVLNHSMTVTGLASSTTYHIILQSKDSTGNVGSTLEFPVTMSP